MLLNHLPDDCLRIIFDDVNGLEDLINCSKVCQRWNFLISRRLNKVKYLIDCYHNFSPAFVHIVKDELVNENCPNRILPNLRILAVSSPCQKSITVGEVSRLIASPDKLKGLIFPINCYDNLMVRNFENIEMISNDTIELAIMDIGRKLKQLYLWDYPLEFFNNKVKHFPNLRRLHISSKQGFCSNDIYHGPILEHLDILEYKCSAYKLNETFYGFQFIDFCPALRSAYLVTDTCNIYIDEQSKHESLQNLVFDLYYFEQFKMDSIHSMETLIKLLNKYPNLKHLAICNCKNLKNENIIDLISILPKLVLFNLRGSPLITSEAEEIVKSYCSQNGRDVKFYYKPDNEDIKRDWPTLSTRHERVSLGFDFMQNCFLKQFHNLPDILDPIDDEV